MKVVYLGRSSRRISPAPSAEGDVIELLDNNWDDFGFKTSFPTICRINGEIIDLGAIKLLVSGEHTTSNYLGHRRQQGWTGEFPVPEADYLSVPSEITFYEQILALLGLEVAKRIATELRDASYLVNIEEDPKAIVLVNTEGFRRSLQRERGDIKSFIDGWKIFANEAMAVMDLGFRFRDIFGNLSNLALKFRSKGPLPHDINVLIGANGTGKSRVLHQIVHDWIGAEDAGEGTGHGFVEKPNLSQIVVVSYSPFEKFPVDLEGHPRQDKDVYRYFGFRDRLAPTRSSQRGQVALTYGHLE